MEVDLEVNDEGQNASDNHVTRLSLSPFMSELGISPMSALARNLDTASISINPRKLSLNNCEESPLPSIVPIIEKSSPTPLSSYRVKISPRNNSPRV
ncbi:uncharacterized protein LOC120351166 isoform X2 [Nilaparvata lugens]|uniref:uncharacterized protein LOC120351166 isoform X2 n=1 Tax=Nilaparvata lugens TaxID=108931 RepID=UPI00193E6A9C|nr:uncharacterized protein LOC120351166 isoform X2 [Nilaparvata lugens]